MSRKEWISLIAFSMCVTLFATDFADAVPRRRRRQNYNYNNYYYGESGFLQVAPKFSDDSSSYRQLEVNYVYEAAMEPTVAHSDRVQVFLDVWDTEILESEDGLVAEVRITDLSNSQESEVRYVPISKLEDHGEYKRAQFEVTNGGAENPVIEAKKVYRFFVNLHREAEEYGEETAYGRVPVPYYVATSGDSEIARARQHVAMRTFREFYYTERGWISDGNAPLDCHAYYMWATGVCTVGAYNDWTNLGSLFGGDFPYHSGWQIPELAEQGSILGDYVRQPGHTFMLLAYDAEREMVWTMESNFNATVEVVNRYVGSGWTVGHLVADHIRPGLYATAAEESDSPEGEMETPTSEEGIVDSLDDMPTRQVGDGSM